MRHVAIPVVTLLAGSPTEVLADGAHPTLAEEQAIMTFMKTLTAGWKLATK
jgi:hypothetical protein